MVFEFYGLESDPFSLRPDLDFLFLSKAHEEAVAHLVYGLEQQEDITLIVGDIGTGKTLAIHRLLQGVSSSFLPVSINVTSLKFEQLLGLILRKMNVVVPSGGGLDLLLHKFEVSLLGLRSSGRKLLLVIDEAQNLAPDDLEGVRLLMNLAQPGSQVIQLVIAGQLGLAEALDQPELRQFKQRVRVEYRLTCLDRGETEAYLAHRLKTAGREAPLFKAAAIDRIYDISGGVPRLVNHLASKAMLAGFVDGAKAIDSKHVDEDDAPGRARPQVAAVPEQKPAPEVPMHIGGDRGSAGGPRFASRRSAPAVAKGRSRVLTGLAITVAVAAVLLVTGVLTRSHWLPWLQEAGASHVGVLDSGSRRPEPVKPTPVPTDNSPVQTDSNVGLVASDEVRPELEKSNDTMLGNKSADSSEAVSPVVASLVPEAPAEAIETDGQAAEVRSGYAVHVASFVDVDRANSLLARYGRNGIPAFVGDKVTGDNRHWFRVYLGPYASEDVASASVAGLRSAGDIAYSLIVRLPLAQDQKR